MRLLLLFVVVFMTLVDTNTASAEEGCGNCWAACEGPCGSLGYPVYAAYCCRNPAEGGYSCYCDCIGGAGSECPDN
jgi:hypothetical protein